MTRAEFISRLSQGLSGHLTEAEVLEHITFYNEMIDDRIEEGIPEEEAVLGIGPIDNVISEILGTCAPEKEKVKKNKEKRKLRGFELVLLILGSPIWLSLLVSAFAVFISLIAVLWSLVAAIWAVFAAFAGSALGFLAAGTVFILEGNVPSGLATIAAGAVLGGLSIFTFFASLGFTRAAAFLTKKAAVWAGSLFSKKEETK